MRGVVLRLCLSSVLVGGGAAAAVAATGIEATYAEHTRGVKLAREERYDDALAILLPLLERFPDDYPLQRDVILINSWKGDCDEVLKRFERLRGRPQLDGYLVPPVADCAVKHARTGDYDGGIDVLTALLPHAPDEFPIRRDLTLLTLWKRDCKRALEWFDPIRDDVRAPPYLLVPVSSCMLRENRRTEALAIIENGLARHPDDAGLQHARMKARIALRLDDDEDDRPELVLGLTSSYSDRDIREWLMRAELSVPVAERVRAYARYLFSRTDDAQFDAGAMNRMGAGVRWRPTARWFIDQGFSTDMDTLDGSHTLVQYRPYDDWTLSAGHDTYAEDISVRARANGIEAKRSQVSLEYDDLNYIWYWRGVVSRYDFTDTNRRTGFYTTLGYAYEMLPAREQRIFVEWYQSHNTLDDALYFNPKRDRSIGLVNRTDFVFDTRYKRHVDHLYLSVGSYTQEGFGSNLRWGVKYEQDYDFDSENSLLIGVGFNRNFYDGQGEDELRFELIYSKRF